MCKENHSILKRNRFFNCIPWLSLGSKYMLASLMTDLWLPPTEGISTNWSPDSSRPPEPEEATPGPAIKSEPTEPNPERTFLFQSLHVKEKIQAQELIFDAFERILTCSEKVFKTQGRIRGDTLFTEIRSPCRRFVLLRYPILAEVP